MSAAEKLKALPVPFDLSEGHSTMLVLVDALPQIVALVEFSESILGSLSRSHGPTMAQVLRELDEALT